jgi:uncharacterized membrane protein YeaQ/YmgE (transglycosylase-associated protein family)
MTIAVWIILGLVAGWLASLIVGSGGFGLIGDIVVGILGALLGGWLASTFLGVDVTGLNVASVAVAVGGAVLLIAIFRAVRTSRRTVTV